MEAMLSDNLGKCFTMQRVILDQEIASGEKECARS